MAQEAVGALDDKAAPLPQHLLVCCGGPASGGNGLTMQKDEQSQSRARGKARFLAASPELLPAFGGSSHLKKRAKAPAHNPCRVRKDPLGRQDSA